MLDEEFKEFMKTNEYKRLPKREKLRLIALARKRDSEGGFAAESDGKPKCERCSLLVPKNEKLCEFCKGENH